MTLYNLTFNEVVDLRRFMGALKVQGLSRDSLPYKAPFQPFGSWFALISTGIITIFKGVYLFTSSLMSFKEFSQFCLGYDTFIPFTKDTFVTSYIGIPIFVISWSGYKLYYRTSLIPAHEVDLITGKREIDEEEEQFIAEEEVKGPRNFLQRMWDSL